MAPKVTHVKKGRKDYPEFGVKRGDEYYWWKFRNEPRQMSLTEPTRAQTTQSAFFKWLYELEDDVFPSIQEDETMPDVLAELIEVISEKIDEQKESLENMPPHLIGKAPSAILLQERIDALSGWVEGLSKVEFDSGIPEVETIGFALGDEQDYWREKKEQIVVIKSGLE